MEIFVILNTTLFEKQILNCLSLTISLDLIQIKKIIISECNLLRTSSGVPTLTRNVSSLALKLSQSSEVWL